MLYLQQSRNKYVQQKAWNLEAFTSGGEEQMRIIIIVTWVFCNWIKLCRESAILETCHILLRTASSTDNCLEYPAVSTRRAALTCSKAALPYGQKFLSHITKKVDLCNVSIRGEKNHLPYFELTFLKNVSSRSLIWVVAALLHCSIPIHSSSSFILRWSQL